LVWVTERRARIAATVTPLRHIFAPQKVVNRFVYTNGSGPVLLLLRPLVVAGGSDRSATPLQDATHDGSYNDTHDAYQAQKLHQSYPPLPAKLASTRFNHAVVSV
jgi:hypothetical protein